MGLSCITQDLHCACKTFRLLCAGSVALQHVGSSSPTKDWTHIPCIGRQLPNHWTIRAVPEVFFSLLVFIAGQSFLSLRWVGITLPCGAWSPHCGGFSCCGAQALGTGSVVCSTRALVAHGMWNLLGPGIESISPALAGRFLSTVPPQKSNILSLKYFCLL